jgi:hypothetical protein
MSDFTKIDLKKLYNILNDMMFGKFYPKSDLHIPKLMDIVRFKIDNYCEHKNTTYDCDYCGLVGCEDCKQATGGELDD